MLVFKYDTAWSKTKVLKDGPKNLTFFSSISHLPKELRPTMHSMMILTQIELSECRLGLREISVVIIALECMGDVDG